MSTHPVSKPSAKKPTVVLVLQGGGALGAYHIGAYQALAEHGLHPNWVCGISSGAINAAVIAGNLPEERSAQLHGLWQSISRPDVVPIAFPQWRWLYNMASNASALLFGQPNFFTPRPINPFLVLRAAPPLVSFYDTTPMRSTLQSFANFELINSKATRLSLGATNIATGELEFFDNADQLITPEHVLASGSLPPGFAATQIGRELYWDGGCVSNTPLDAVIDAPHHPHLVVFMIDLWNATGAAPHNMYEVLWRAKQIQYASRTAHYIDAVATKVNLRHALGLLKAAGAAAVAAAPDNFEARRVDIVHVIYSPGPNQFPNSDAEFSRASLAERSACGYRDLQAAIAAQPWLQDLPPHLGALVHRVQEQRVTTLPEPNLHSMSDAANGAVQKEPILGESNADGTAMVNDKPHSPIPRQARVRRRPRPAQTPTPSKPE